MGCDINTVAQVRNGDGNWRTEAENIANEWRSYDSYAVLANVRNGYGFAGCDTGEGWEPIAKPRGLPDGFEIDDMECHKYGYDKKKWLGDHSYSWVTLKELKDKLRYYDGKFYEVHGMISEGQAKELEKGVLPDSWCGYTNQVGYVKATWKVAVEEMLKWLGLVVRHLELIRDCSRSSGVTDDGVRLVFGFDS